MCRQTKHPPDDRRNSGGPPYAPMLLVLFPFRFRDRLSGRWVKARYVAERAEIAARIRP